MRSDISTEKIAEWRSSGKKALGIICCHVPFELLHAAEILPVRLRATSCADCSQGEACLGDHSCGFTKAILQYLCDGKYDLDGLVTSNGCEVASGIITNWKMISAKRKKEQFFYELTAPRMANEMSYRFFRSELEDLRDRLEDLTGGKITDEKLKSSIAAYNEARRLVARLYGLHKAEKPVVSGEETLRITLAATEMRIEDYVEYLKAALAAMAGREPLKGFTARVMLVGSALDDPEYVRAIEEFGCLVVADLNSFGTRFLRDELPCDNADPLGAVARYYLNRSSCPRMMDGSDGIHEYIFSAAEEYNIDGVIIEGLRDCDRWENEAPILEEKFRQADIPCLTLGRQELLSAKGQLGIRVEAFRELIENRKGV